MNKAKEKMLRLYLDKFIKETQEGAWLWELNPDNVTIEFWDLGDWAIGMSVGKKIILNSKYQAVELFSTLVHELWHLKQRRENPVRYWIFKIPFFRHKIENSAEEKEAIAEDWLLKKGYCD
jgi:predicted AAA+ superfamily ATPase